MFWLQDKRIQTQGKKDRKTKKQKTKKRKKRKQSKIKRKQNSMQCRFGKPS